MIICMQAFKAPGSGISLSLSLPLSLYNIYIYIYIYTCVYTYIYVYMKFWKPSVPHGRCTQTRYTYAYVINPLHINASVCLHVSTYTYVSAVEEGERERERERERAQRSSIITGRVPWEEHARPAVIEFFVYIIMILTNMCFPPPWVPRLIIIIIIIITIIITIHTNDINNDKSYNMFAPHVRDVHLALLQGHLGGLETLSSKVDDLCIYIYIYIHIYIYICTHILIYIYIERERDGFNPKP